MRCAATRFTFTSSPIRAAIYERFSRNDYCVLAGKSSLIGRCLQAVVWNQSPDGGTRVLQEKLTITENADFQYATNRLFHLHTPQNTKPPATRLPPEKLVGTYVAWRLSTRGIW